MSEGRLNLDLVDHQRIASEIARIKKILTNGRSAAKTTITEEHANNWHTAFGTFNSEGKPGYPVFQWEEVMESTLGYKIDRRKKIGTGTFGEVYPVHGTNDVGHIVVKIFKKKEFAELFHVQDLGRHFSILVQLNHPNIARLVGVFGSIKTEKMYLFSQMAPYGSLEKAVSEPGIIPESLAKRWSRELAVGLSYLHFLGIAYRKLTPKAVLLDSAQGTVKLEVPYCFAEIGDPSKKQANEVKTKSSPSLVTAFNAPETVFGSSFNPLPSDVWSYGCVVYYMMIKKGPLDNWKDRKAVKQQLDKKVWQFSGRFDNHPKLPKEATVFLTFILHGTIDKRPSMAEVLSLPWLN